LGPVKSGGYDPPPGRVGALIRIAGERMAAVGPRRALGRVDVYLEIAKLLRFSTPAAIDVRPDDVFVLWLG
jgi:hypothetical protein